MASEFTPLVQQHENPSAAGSNAPSFYFIKQSDRADSSMGEAVSVQDGGQEIDTIPQGATSDEFASRPVRGSPKTKRKVPSNGESRANGGKGMAGWIGKLFGGGGTRRASFEAQGTGIGTLVRERKVPIKIEPKVFFANERTFLAWLHVSIMLAGAAIAIVAFADANPWSQLYGVLLLPVACAFICYSMWQYAKRAAMIRRKDPGPYEDTMGPTVLGIMLMLSIVFQFCIKLYSMM